MDKRRVVTDIMTIALVAAMVGVAELLGEKEIIFPEITALAIGAWIAPQQVWRTNRPVSYTHLDVYKRQPVYSQHHVWT